ncbi:hypothetical protein ACIODW_20965 [Streptomyces sp. NPDC087897]
MSRRARIMEQAATHDLDAVEAHGSEAVQVEKGSRLRRCTSRR